MFDFLYNDMDLISPSRRAVVANLPSNIVVLLWIVVVVTSPNIAIVFKHDVISVKSL
jgi:Flp pilus assembly CpaE family ATPase